MPWLLDIEMQSFHERFKLMVLVIFVCFVTLSIFSILYKLSPWRNNTLLANSTRWRSLQPCLCIIQIWLIFYKLDAVSFWWLIWIKKLARGIERTVGTHLLFVVPCNIYFSFKLIIEHLNCVIFIDLFFQSFHLIGLEVYVFFIVPSAFGTFNQFWLIVALFYRLICKFERCLQVKYLIEFR